MSVFITRTARNPETMMPRLASAARVAALVAALAVAGVPARAQDAPPASVPVPAEPSAPSAAPAPGDGRYTLHPAQDSFMRLDSRTGQMSLCARAASGWSCQAVPDERAALESEIARLQGDNAALKKELLARGVALPDGVRADQPPPPPPPLPPAAKGDGPVVRLPTDAEFDRAMAFIEKAWRRMVEMMVDLQRDIQRKN